MVVSRRSKLAAFLSHPYWLLVVSLAGACMAMEYAIMYKANGREMRISMMTAIAIGLPAILYTKHLAKQHISFYAEYSFQIGDRAVYLEFWRRNWKNLSANLPLTLAVVATWMASHYLSVQWAPMVGMMLILCVLLYPEQEEIHNRIKAKIMELAADGDDA